MALSLPRIAALREGEGEGGYKKMVWRTLWKLPALQSLVAWRFETVARNVVELEDAMEFAFSGRFGDLITPIQMRSEIRALCEIVRAYRPKTVLEIGTERGGTFFLFSRVALPDASLISVDIPRTDLKPWRRTLFARLARKGQNISAINGDSHATSTVESVRRVLGGRSLDFLFIDGDHRYESVKQDFESYVSLLNHTGIVAFHDINHKCRSNVDEPTTVRSGEVYRFWTEVKMKYPHAELIASPDRDGFGIGILFIGSVSEKTLVTARQLESHTLKGQS